MATDKVQICNMALARIGVSQFIANLTTERSNEAINCNLFYDTVLAFALRDYDWNFSRRTVALSLATGAVAPNWTYKYSYPNDCFFARAIVPVGIRFPRADQRIPFDIGNDGATRVIYTDQADAVLRYSALIDNPVLYDPQFVSAFAFLLGSELAIPLSIKPDIAKSARDAYVLTASRAMANDLRERESGPEPDPALIAYRNG
jgi:hypothetical protein